MIILMQTPHVWSGIAQRCHHLARRFARAGHHVVWVESRYLAWLWQRPHDFRAPRSVQPEPRLDVRTRTLVNGERFAPVRAHNKFWLARSLASGLARARGEGAEGPVVLWLYNPHEGHLADRVPHDLLIYDIMDEYTGFPWSPPQIEAEESALLARADWVFAGTGALDDAKRPQAEGRIECILSGVESEFFASGGEALAEDEPLLTLRQQYRHLAGYAGMLDLRLDQALIAEVARARPDWGFAFVGPLACDLDTIKDLPNVHLLGPRPYSQLPALYRLWDAALLPFVENTLTRHINPTKMLEYAAADVPILARALPDVRRFYAEGAWLHENAGEFLVGLDQIANNHSDVATRKAAASAWGQTRSWDALATRMLTRIEQLSQS